ncbi:hypothetical protein C8R47DRAFT_1083563 [Mycena vitilis]|nr:hypothetical protein C8R47DRAFT_1083563 [Mycena vitilis]
MSIGFRSYKGDGGEFIGTKQRKRVDAIRQRWLFSSARDSLHSTKHSIAMVRGLPKLYRNSGSALMVAHTQQRFTPTPPAYEVADPTTVVPPYSGQSQLISKNPPAYLAQCRQHTSHTTVA